jgi:hypothetical protein
MVACKEQLPQREQDIFDWDVHKILAYNLEIRGVTPVHSFLIEQVLQTQPVAQTAKSFVGELEFAP